MQKARKHAPIAAPALVRLPICQTLGAPEGCTLSVVTDIPRKSPVIMMITMSIGVSIACPVTTSPSVMKTTLVIFLVKEFSV